MIFMFSGIHYCLQMFSKILEISVLKYMDLILLIFCARISIASFLKKTEVKLELLTGIDLLLMVEEGIRGGICQAIHRYSKADNKYMNNYDKYNKSSYLMYLDASNLCG